ncbi:SAF domain-containing protein [Bifidobacterium parmae]|uniref:Flagellar basal body P-ring biosynthesis protein n=1 Tax=Bifidobacterium parmae TaxID=361854 RepID=A0A2N5IW35_9BIFI|nr:SAF domain-containing protein [Bifidobacterium parmae]PLS26157.1 Flagellar basal body P-ring biosynthesis protein [Bifidobacterium parmae]
MSDPPWARLTRPTLAARRARARLARLAAAVCVIAVAVASVLLVDALVATTDVVVAAHALRRGDVIGADDVIVVETPRSPVVAGAFGHVDDVVGRVAQTDLEERQPLFPTNARDAPVVPSGRTVLEVAVANDASTLVAGDSVRLVSATGCASSVAEGGGAGNAGTDAPAAGAGATPGSEESGADEPACTLAGDALVMSRARRDENGGGTSVIAMAMTPEAAARVMASAELGAIVAVTR